MPMKVISALLGIPENDQEKIRDHANAQMRTEAGKPMAAAQDGLVTGDIFAACIDWRKDNPSDDIMMSCSTSNSKTSTASPAR